VGEKALSIQKAYVGKIFVLRKADEASNDLNYSSLSELEKKQGKGV